MAGLLRQGFAGLLKGVRTRQKTKVILPASLGKSNLSLPLNWSWASSGLKVTVTKKTSQLSQSPAKNPEFRILRFRGQRDSNYRELPKKARKTVFPTRQHAYRGRLLYFLTADCRVCIPADENLRILRG